MHNNPPKALFRSVDSNILHIQFGTMAKFFGFLYLCSFALSAAVSVSSQGRKQGITITAGTSPHFLTRDLTWAHFHYQGAIRKYSFDIPALYSLLMANLVSVSNPGTPLSNAPRKRDTQRDHVPSTDYAAPEKTSYTLYFFQKANHIILSCCSTFACFYPELTAHERTIMKRGCKISWRELKAPEFQNFRNFHVYAPKNT